MAGPKITSHLAPAGAMLNERQLFATFALDQSDHFRSFGRDKPVARKSQSLLFRGSIGSPESRHGFIGGNAGVRASTHSRFSFSVRMKRSAQPLRLGGAAEGGGILDAEEAQLALERVGHVLQAVVVAHA